MSSLSNETLLKRANHAGRNLFVLASLATAGGIAFTLMTFSIKDGPPIAMVLAATFAFIAAGYWLLTVAARRGNPLSVGIVIVFAVTHIVLNLVAAGIAAARTQSDFKPNIGGLIIPILVMIALSRSRNVLLELRKRGLWEQAFGSAKPSSHLCVIGGVLVAAGLVGLNTGWVYVNRRATAEIEQQHRQAEAFVQLLNEEEQGFLVTIPPLSDPNRDASVKATLARIAVLEQKVGGMQHDIANNRALGEVLTTYGAAVRQWKNALLILKEPNPDMERAMKMLQLAARLRADATQAFNRRYAAKTTR